jgi:hypothetical protein
VKLYDRFKIKLDKKRAASKKKKAEDMRRNKLRARSSNRARTQGYPSWKSKSRYTKSVARSTRNKRSAAAGKRVKFKTRIASSNMVKSERVMKSNSDAEFSQS